MGPTGPLHRQLTAPLAAPPRHGTGGTHKARLRELHLFSRPMLLWSVRYSPQLIDLHQFRSRCSISLRTVEQDHRDPHRGLNDSDHSSSASVFQVIHPPAYKDYLPEPIVATTVLATCQRISLRPYLDAELQAST